MKTTSAARRRELAEPVSGLDWALLTLLQSVRTEFVDKMIEKWTDGLTRMEDAYTSGQPSDAEYRYAHNLRTAIALAAKDTAAQDFNPDHTDWSKPKIAQLKTDLNAAKASLFNSYYFITISSYGDSDEYFFFPIVPGRSSLPMTMGGATSEMLGEYLGGLNLPFIPPLARLTEYTGTLLPGRVGLTPQVCLIARKEGHQTPEPVPLFMGDFAILGKAEDAAWRHHSALVAPLLANDDKRSCLGAFLATSVVPDAFKGSFGRDDSAFASDALEKVIDEWRKAPLRQLHASARRESREAIVSIQWPKLLDARLDMTPIRDAAEDWLHKLGEHGAAALQSHDGATESALCAINPDSLAMSLRSSLTPGPLLASSVYTVADEPTGHVARSEDVVPMRSVSSLALSTLLRDLHQLGAAKKPVSVVGTNLFNHHIKDFIQLAGHNLPAEALNIRTARQGDVSAAAIYAPTSAEAMREIEKHIKDLAQRVLEESKRQRPALPGERQSVYPTLERLYHRDVHDCLPPGDASRTDSYKLVEVLLATPGVIGVLLFEHDPIYVAESCRPAQGKSWPQPLSAAVFNPASYWVFEQICQLAAMEEFPVEKVGPDSAYFNPAPFVAAQNLIKGPPVNVTLSRLKPINHNVISAFNYLGVPVTTWAAKEGEQFAIPMTDVGRGVAKYYRGYLAKLLLDTSNVPCISRAIRTAHGVDEKKVTIGSIELGGAEPNAECISFTFHGSIDGAAETVVSKWRRTDTMRLEFSAFNVSQLAENHADHLASKLRRTERMSARSWSPRAGWAETPLNDGYENVFHRIKEGLEQSDAFRTYLLTHESGPLLHTLNDLIGASAAHPDLAPLALEAKIERDLFLLQMGQVLDGTSSFAAIGGDNFYDELVWLLSIAARHGVHAASDILFRGGTLVDSRAWREAFLALTLDRIGRSQLEDLRLHNRHKVTAQTANVLLLVRLFSNVFKHGLLDLYFDSDHEGWVSHDPNNFNWQAFAASLDISFESDRIAISNWCAPNKSDAIFKDTGTHRVLTQYLTNSDAWGAGAAGRIKTWDILDRDVRPLKFTTEVTLPTTFWRSPP